MALAVVAALGMAAPVFAEANSHYNNGDFTVGVGVGFGWGISLIPGIDLTFGEFKLADGYGLDFGLAVKGMFSFYNAFSYSYNAFGAGAYFMLHFGLKNFPSDFLKKLDFYWGPGLRFLVFSSNLPGYVAPASFGFSTVGGTQYFLSESVSVFVEYSYSYGSYADVGINFKL